MLNTATQLGAVVVDDSSNPESSAVAFWTFQRQREGGKTHTINFTLRPHVGEDEYTFFNRVMAFIDAVEQQPYGFKAIDVERQSWNKGGGGGKQSANIPDRFQIVAVEKVARPNKNAKQGEDPNWYYLICHGEGGVSCQAFIGNPKWQPENPIKKSGQFEKFFSWKVGERMNVPSNMELYAITATGKYGKEVTDIEPHSDSGL